MNDPNSYGYQEMAPAGQQPIIPSPYKFSPDELRVLGECNRESFIQRSMPFGTIFGLGAYAAVQKGHLRPNPRFGAMPKVSLAVIVGYFLGKLSYQQACAEKLMALPGSYIGQLLRDKRDGKPGGPGPNQTRLPGAATGMLGAGPGDIYSDAGPGSSLDLDTERPLFSEDNYRPDINDGSSAAPERAPARPSLSYDDLRRQNRGEYKDTKQDPYRLDPSATPPINRARPAPPAPTATNKYGDAME